MRNSMSSQFKPTLFRNQPSLAAKVLAISAWCSLLLSGMVRGTDITWTNGNGGWDTSIFWSPNTIPGTNDRAIFNDSSSIAGYAVALNISNEAVGNIQYGGTTKGVFWKGNTNTLTVINNFNMDQTSGATAIGTLRNGIVAVTNSSGTAAFNVGSYTSGGKGLLTMSHQTSAGDTNILNYPTLIANNFLVTSNSTFLFTAGTLTTSGGSIDCGSNLSMTVFAPVAGDISTWNVIGGTNSIAYLGTGGTNEFAFTTGGTVNLNVVGPNTLLNAGGVLFAVGWNGFVNVVVSNGGQIANSGTLYLSRNGASSSNDTIVVTGAGSQWTSANEFFVGNASRNNSLTISAGGVVSSTTARVGEGAGSSNNVVTVTGTNSQWKQSNLLSVGDSAGGNSLIISNGGQVINTGTTTRWGLNASSGNNSLIVDGAGSRLIGTNGALSAGNTGFSNNLIIRNGGQVLSLGVNLGAAVGSSNNTIVVTGTNSSWTATGIVNVGPGDAGNQLIVTNAGQLLAGGVDLTPTNKAGSVVIVDGGTLIATNSVSGAVMRVGGANLQGTVTFNSGTIRIDQLMLTNGIASVFNFNGGVLNVKTSVVANTSAFVVGNGSSAATLNLLAFSHSYANGLTISTNATLSGIGTISGTVTLGNGATLAPGLSGVGTQTVVGAVVLNPGAILNYEFRSPSGASDLVKITGDLTLAGTLNVTDLGGFSNGTYTVFSYTGNLTNNTLNVGSLPSGFVGVVSNDVAGKLVLLNVTCTAAAGPISGSASVNAGDSGVNYSISSVNGATTYTWTVPSGASIASGQGTTSITVNYGCSAVSGNVTVTPVNVSGCTGVPSSLGVTVTSVGAAGSITGLASVNAGDSGVTYSISSVSGATTYTWTVPTGATIASGQGTTSITVNYGCSAVSGNVSVTPANANACTGTGSTLAITVTGVGAAGTISGTGTVNTGDSGDTYSISAVSGATTYAWIVPTGATIASGQGTTSITVNYSCSAVSGNVSVTPANANACTGTGNSLAITVTGVDAAGSITGPGAVNGGDSGVGYSISSVSGATTYAWTAPVGAVVSSGQGTTSITIHYLCGSPGGNVTVTPRNANSCSGASSSLGVTVTNVAAVGGTATPTAGSVCSGDGTTITLSGNVGLIQWQSSFDNATYANITDATNTTVSTGPLVTNTYYRAVATSSPCSAATSSVAAVTINVTAPSISAAPVSTNVCATSTASFSVAASGNGPLSYMWRKRGTGWANGWTLNVGGGGFFVFDSANNNNGDPSSNGGNDINSGGKAWGLYNTGGGVTEALRPFDAALAVGETLSIDMDNGSVVSGNSVGCGLQNTSSGLNRLEIYFVGGAGDYTISDGTGTHDSGVAFTKSGINVLFRLTGANTYVVTITRYIDGSIRSFAGTLANSGGIDRARLFDDNGQGGNDYDLYFNNLRVACADDNAADAAYTSGWNNGANGGQMPLVNGGDIAGANTTTLTISPALLADGGSYDVCVDDACGLATISSAATLTVNPNPSCVVTPSSAAICAGSTQTFTVNPSGGTVPYTYLWSDGSTGASLNTNAAGTYSVTVTDSNGCTTACSATLTINPTPSCAVSPATATICAGGTQQFTVTPSGGTPGYTFLWSTGATTSNITASAAGPYSVTVTDSNGCTTTCSATLTVNPTPSCVVTPSSASICAGSAQTFTVNPSGGTPGYTYLWSDGSTGASINTNATGTYSVTVTDSNGCTTSCSATLTVNALPGVFNVTGGGAYCTGGVAVGLDGSQSGVSYQLLLGGNPTGSPVSGGGGTITFGNQTASGSYTVSASNTTTGCTSGMAGSATVTVTDPFQCWQLQYFGCTNCPQADAAADPDGDGQNNLAEYLAGTIPTNNASALRITAITRSGTDITITWSTAGGRTNMLQATGGTVDGSYITNSFVDVAGSLTVIGGSGDASTNYVDVGGATNAPSRYYRVRLVP